MNPEKRRRRAKLKAKLGRMMRNGGQKRLRKIANLEVEPNIEDYRMFGQFGLMRKRAI